MTATSYSFVYLVGLAAVLVEGLVPGEYPHIPRHDKTTLEMILDAGYPAEKHEVTTEDCYKLAMHRIPGDGKIVFLQHGLIDSSAAWVLAGTDHGGLAFRLADAGYDVWMGNYRGNVYSRQHCTLDPDNDQEFWHFSWDEMAHYDLPAELEYVLGHTGKEKLFYVGHSMGSTTYFVMNSLNQTWADRVELATFLAPVAYVDHMASPIAYIAPFAFAVDWIAENLGFGEFALSDWLSNLLASLFCENSWLEGICENVMFLLCGYDEKQMNETMVATIVQHLPAGTSTFTVLHYAQEVNKKEFQGFDWGSEEANMQHHGQPSPPKYNLEDVNTQIALYWGDNDWLAQPGDLMQIIMKCQNVIYENYQIPWEGWNHLDFMYAIDVDKYINIPLIDMLNNFQN